MAAAAPAASIFRCFSSSSTSHNHGGSSAYLFPSNPNSHMVSLRTPPPSRRSSAVTLARRKKSANGNPRPVSPKNQKIMTEEEDDVAEDDLDEDAFEALFAQLEEDLKNDNLPDDDIDEEISEEDLARLEKELDEALSYDEHDGSSEISASDQKNIDNVDEVDDMIRLPKLKNWQLKRLARALKIGRRKTSIKNLSAELGLDRAVVLELLREPPPTLLLMSASLPDEDIEPPSEISTPPVVSPTTENTEEAKPEVRVPVHVLQSRWITQKRLKKVQVETLERVYSRTKRPTNAMISSIVHVTNLPWKRVVKWFEDKRKEDGVPEQRAPYQRI